MELNTLLALFVALVGLLLYWFCTPGARRAKLARIGEIMLFTGLLVALFVLSGKHAEASFHLR
jgi:hypothetical protein